MPVGGAGEAASLASSECQAPIVRIVRKKFTVCLRTGDFPESVPAQNDGPSVNRLFRPEGIMMSDK